MPAPVTPLSRCSCGRRPAALRLLILAAAIGSLSSCGVPAPTTEELRQAYAAHVQVDRVHERGLEAKHAPLVIPQQEPNCIFETPAGHRSEEQNVHIRRDGAAWVIDSVN